MTSYLCSTSKNVSYKDQHGNECVRCLQPVQYDERMGPIKGAFFHKDCFKCAECGQRLSKRTYYTSFTDTKDKEVYCKKHMKGKVPTHTYPESILNLISMSNDCSDEPSEMDMGVPTFRAPEPESPKYQTNINQLQAYVPEAPPTPPTSPPEYNPHPHPLKPLLGDRPLFSTIIPISSQSLHHQPSVISTTEVLVGSPNTTSPDRIFHRQVSVTSPQDSETQDDNPQQLSFRTSTLSSSRSIDVSSSNLAASSPTTQNIQARSPSNRGHLMRSSASIDIPENPASPINGCQQTSYPSDYQDNSKILERSLSTVRFSTPSEYFIAAPPSPSPSPDHRFQAPASPTWNSPSRRSILKNRAQVTSPLADAPTRQLNSSSDLYSPARSTASTYRSNSPPVVVSPKPDRGPPFRTGPHPGVSPLAASPTQIHSPLSTSSFMASPNNTGTPLSASPSQRRSGNDQLSASPSQRRSGNAQLSASPSQRRSEYAPLAASPSQRRSENTLLAASPSQRRSENAPLSASPSQRRSDNAPLAASPSQRRSEYAPLAASPSQRRPENAPLSASPSQRRSENTPLTATPSHRRSENAPLSASPSQRRSENTLLAASPSQRRSRRLENAPLAASPSQRRSENAPFSASPSQQRSVTSPLAASPSQRRSGNAQLAASPSQRSSIDRQLAASPSQRRSGDTQLAASPSQRRSGDTQLAASPSQRRSGDTQLAASPSQRRSGDTQLAASPSQRRSGDKKLAASPSQRHQNTSALPSGQSMDSSYGSSGLSGASEPASTRRVLLWTTSPSTASLNKPSKVEEFLPTPSPRCSMNIDPYHEDQVCYEDEPPIYESVTFDDDSD